MEITGGQYAMQIQRALRRFVRPGRGPGLPPAESRAFRSADGSQTFDFALERGEEQLSGVVLLPDGKPAAGAEVVIDTRNMGFLMQAGQFDRRANVPKVTAGSDGRFTFSRPGEKFLLVAISDAGYAACVLR